MSNPLTRRFHCRRSPWKSTYVMDAETDSTIIAFGEPGGYSLANRVCAKLNDMPLAVQAVEAESAGTNLQGLYFLCTKLAQEIGE
jgi:hypothetical protein